MNRRNGMLALLLVLLIVCFELYSERSNQAKLAQLNDIISEQQKRIHHLEGFSATINSSSSTTSTHHVIPQDPTPTIPKVDDDHQILGSDQIAIGILTSRDTFRIRHGEYFAMWKEDIEKTGALVYWFSDFAAAANETLGLPEAYRAEGWGMRARFVSQTVSLYRMAPNNTQWFIFCDDDTVLFLEHLKWVLQQYDPALPWYIGNWSEQQSGVNFWHRLPYGGAGMAVSRPVLAMLEKGNTGWLCLDKYGGDFTTAGGDGAMNACMGELGVAMTRSPSFHQVDFEGDISGLLEGEYARTPIVSLHHLEKMKPFYQLIEQYKARIPKRPSRPGPMVHYNEQEIAREKEMEAASQANAPKAALALAASLKLYDAYRSLPLGSFLVQVLNCHKDLKISVVLIAGYRLRFYMKTFSAFQLVRTEATWGESFLTDTDHRPVVPQCESIVFEWTGTSRVDNLDGTATLKQTFQRINIPEKPCEFAAEKAIPPRWKEMFQGLTTATVTSSSKETCYKRSSGTQYEDKRPTLTLADLAESAMHADLHWIDCPERRLGKEVLAEHCAHTKLG
eukprot:TRINITY_DN8690_c0_g1_i1.p1 TRINITY_DN8690_c0_g1~~TRINITY_DN8690_c0_g1_i1.p1  ORF type:complete len:563 (-),score=128.77 TRINITY_DN8690_c0_g1_i1:156-1844(-)